MPKKPVDYKKEVYAMFPKARRAEDHFGYYIIDDYTGDVISFGKKKLTAWKRAADEARRLKKALKRKRSQKPTRLKTPPMKGKE